MIDEMHDRHYQAGRQALNATLIDALGELRQAIRNSFEVLNRIEYAAPWAGTRKSSRLN